MLRCKPVPQVVKHVSSITKITSSHHKECSLIQLCSNQWTCSFLERLQSQ
jgi:hypothetical protein